LFTDGPYYSDLRSSKPEIMLICGDLQFSGRPAINSLGEVSLWMVPVGKSRGHSVIILLLHVLLNEIVRFIVIFSDNSSFIGTYNISRSFACKHIATSPATWSL